MRERKRFNVRAASPQFGAAMKINDRQTLVVEERRFDLD